MRAVFLSLLVLAAGCNSTREFWNYVVEDNVEKPMAQRESGTRDTQKLQSPHNVKVVYNDGKTMTEVIIPVLESGQQIVLENRYDRSPVGLSVIPIPPTEADRSIEEEYVKEGNPVNKAASPVSIVGTQERIRALVKEGNYGLALQFADLLLKKYPNHVKTLQAKGSILLKLGETKAALAAYYKAQEISPDPKVEEQIKKLEQAQN